MSKHVSKQRFLYLCTLAYADISVCRMYVGVYTYKYVWTCLYAKWVNECLLCVCLSVFGMCAHVMSKKFIADKNKCTKISCKPTHAHTRICIKFAVTHTVTKNGPYKQSNCKKIAHRSVLISWKVIKACGY